MQSENKILAAIISHKMCIDGSAAVLYAQSIQPNVEYHFANHTEINDLVLKTIRRIRKGGTLWIVDICCDREILYQLFELAKKENIKLCVYEHHISRKWVGDIKSPPGVDFNAIFDLNRCGSKIFYDVHRPNNPQLRLFKDFSVLINDRDLWLNVDKRGALVARLHNIYGDELFVDRILQDPTMQLTEKERILLDYQERKESEYHNLLLETIKIDSDINGFNYGIIYGNGASSELLERAIFEKNLEYAILVNLNTKRGSIRSRGHFNCAEYAMNRGGGGHKCAAGFPVEFEYPPL